MSKVRQPNHRDERTVDSQAGFEGVAFIATLRGFPGRDVLDTALDALNNLHRGESTSSGVLTHIPHSLFKAELGSDLPRAGRYAVGFLFMEEEAEQQLIVDTLANYDFAVLAWREVPVNDTIVDLDPRATMPTMRQVFIIDSGSDSPADMDVRLYRARKVIEEESQAYFASLSRNTIVYKGLLPATKLAAFYNDLANPKFATEMAVVHSTGEQCFQSWNTAQPHRMLAHDGQIHSEVTNAMWLRARQQQIQKQSDALIGKRSCTHERVEGALDDFIELLHHSGRDITHALRMVFPEQWGRTMSPQEQDFFDYTAMVMEPWEGSGVTCFADGDLIGAVLDRHGTRSGRYWITETGLVVFASETGVVDFDPSIVTKKGRLAPGEMIAVDTIVGNLIPSNAIRARLATLHPYREWLEDYAKPVGKVTDPKLPIMISTDYHIKASSLGVVEDLAQGKQHLPGQATSRELTFFDRFRSPRSHLTWHSIDQATVPAPPGVYLGPEGNVLIDGPEHIKVVVDGPAISISQLESLSDHLKVHRIEGLCLLGDDLADRIQRIRNEVASAVEGGANIIVLSNKGAATGRTMPIPSLLLAATGHEALRDLGVRTQASLVIEAGDAVEPLDITRLIEAGAEAVVPYHGEIAAGPNRAETYFRTLNEEVYRILLTSGVAEYGAYVGSRRFHIVGLANALVDEFFPGASRGLGGFDLTDLDKVLGVSQQLLTPLHLLLTPRPSSGGTPVEPQKVDELVEFLTPLPSVEVTQIRRGVDLDRLAQASRIVVTPPAHHDTIGPDGLRTFIKELRMVNPKADVHVRIGADLESDLTAGQALNAGANAISLVDGEYEWVFGLLALGQSEMFESTYVAVDAELLSATDVFIAVALGATEVRLHPSIDIPTVAIELQELLSFAGVNSIDEVTGRRDLIDWSDAVEQWSQIGVDLKAIPHNRLVETTFGHPPSSLSSFDDGILALVEESLTHGSKSRINTYVGNTNASVGAKIAGEISRRYGSQGLSEDTIRITLTGSSGVGLGAFGARGMKIIVQGEAGDFVGKGLSGGQVIVRPEVTAGFFSQVNVIAGSAIGYGAQSGEIYLAGEVGERLGAHNWGATIVTEGAGDAAGYRMHAGTIVVLGTVGDNLGVGMEGGVIYALDLHAEDLERPNLGETIIVDHLNETDERVLTAIIAKHVENTQSRIGTLLLAEPDQLRSRFSKVHTVGYTPQSNCSGGTRENVWDEVLRATENI